MIPLNHGGNSRVDDARIAPEGADACDHPVNALEFVVGRRAAAVRSGGRLDGGRGGEVRPQARHPRHNRRRACRPDAAMLQPRAAPWVSGGPFHRCIDLRARSRRPRRPLQGVDPTAAIVAPPTVRRGASGRPRNVVGHGAPARIGLDGNGHATVAIVAATTVSASVAAATRPRVERATTVVRYPVHLFEVRPAAPAEAAVLPLCMPARAVPAAACAARLPCTFAALLSHCKTE